MPIDHNHHNSEEDDEEYDVAERELDDEIEFGPIKDAGSGMESGRPKRKVTPVRDFPPGCGRRNSGQVEPEYPDWFDEIEFEEEIMAQEEEDSVCWPPSNPTGGGSDTKAGLESEEVPGFESGFEDQPVAKKRKSLALEQVEENVIVMGLLAPQLCPWRDSKGRLKKRSSRLIKFS